MNKLVILKNKIAFKIRNVLFFLFCPVCCQDIYFNMYEVELSNKQGDKIDKLTEVIKNKQLVRINFKYFFLKLRI